MRSFSSSRDARRRERSARRWRRCIADAVGDGDLALKKGKPLYLHRPAGVAARPRRRSPSPATTRPKAFKAAVAPGSAR